MIELKISFFKILVQIDRASLLIQIIKLSLSMQHIHQAFRLLTDTHL